MKRLIILFLICSCQNTPKTVEAVQEIKSQAKLEESKPINTHKFVFVITETTEPELNYFEARYDLGTEELALVNFKKFRYISEIKEYENFNEDEGYKLMDMAKKQIKNTYSKFQLDVLNKVRNNLKREDLLKNIIKVDNCIYKEYDSYKEASIRADSLENFTEI